MFKRRIKGPISFLDIGCGDAKRLRGIAMRPQSKSRILVGIDSSLGRHTRLGAKGLGNLKLVKGDALAALRRFNDMSCKVVNMDMPTLEFSKREIAAIIKGRGIRAEEKSFRIFSEIHRVLKPGGRLYLTLVPLIFPHFKQLLENAGFKIDHHRPIAVEEAERTTYTLKRVMHYGGKPGEIPIRVVAVKKA